MIDKDIPDLAIIIPTYNRRKVTVACVSSLLSNNYPKNKIFICDSDSKDGTREAVAVYPDVIVINVGDEVWWSGAVNRGIELAMKGNFDCVLLINDDITIPKNIISQLFGKSRRYPNKIISPAQIDKSGIYLGTKYSGKFRKVNRINKGLNAEPTDVDSSNGCCLLIPMETFRIAGLFDEKHCPHIIADVEFQLRARDYGYSTIAVPDVIIEQHPNTDYDSKMRLRSLLTGKGSPHHLISFLTFGRRLYGSWFRFVIFGAISQYIYFRSLLRGIYVAVFRNKSI